MRSNIIDSAMKGRINKEEWKWNVSVHERRTGTRRSGTRSAHERSFFETLTAPRPICFSFVFFLCAIFHLPQFLQRFFFWKWIFLIQSFLSYR